MPLRPLSRRALLLAALAAPGCASTADDSGGGELPPADTSSDGEDSAVDTFSWDTSIEDSGGDESPKHTLTITHEGGWSMAPDGGPWVSATGEIVVTEVLDGDEAAPTCEVTFALTGEASDEGCPGCDATFDLLYYVGAGVREDCRDPDLPQDGDVVRMGWSDAEETVFLDYQGSGVWLAWYEGRRVGDEVTFTWESALGVTVEDE